MTNRWSHTDAPRGAAYDSRWDSLAAQGIAVHGEVDCCEWLCDEFSLPRRVLDAGCGTGRVGLELAQRGFAVVGVDADESMLATARIKAAGQQRSIGVSGTSEWLLADLATWQQPDETQPFGLAVMAGNVMIFVEPDSERAVVENIARSLVPGGILVAGFQLRSDRLSLTRYDEICASNELEMLHRWATWDRAAFIRGGEGRDKTLGGDAASDYAVSVHQRT